MEEVLRVLGPQLTSGGALVAFLCTLVVMVLLARARSRTNELKAALARKDAVALGDLLAGRFRLSTEKLPDEQRFALAQKTLDHEHQRFIVLSIVLTLSFITCVFFAIVYSSREPDLFEGWCYEQDETLAREDVAPCNGPGVEARITLVAPAHRSPTFAVRASRGIRLVSDQCDLDDDIVESCDFDDSNRAEFVAIRCGAETGAVVPNLRLELGGASRTGEALPRCD